MTAAIDHLLAPLDLDGFLAEHWGRRLLHLRRADAGHFRDIVSMAEIDQLVTSIRIPATNLNLARNDLPLALADYCSGGGFVDKHRLLQRHQEGATIILRSIEQWSANLNRLRAAAEAAFGCEAQVNVYLTPPGEKSTPPHWDTHDLLVLQISGEKRWKIYRGERTLPLPHERFRPGADVAIPGGDDLLLEPGDTLYLPAGAIHEPVAQSYSVHLSIGLHTRRAVDLASEALRLAAAEEGSPLRQPIDWRDGPRALGLASGAGGGLEPFLAPALAALRRDDLSRRAVDLEGRLMEIQAGPTLDPAAWYRRRAGVAFETEIGPAALRLKTGGQVIDAPLALQPAVAVIAAADAFRPCDLPGAATLDQRVALCVALWETASLQFAPETRSPVMKGRADRDLRVDSLQPG